MATPVHLAVKGFDARTEGSTYICYMHLRMDAVVADGARAAALVGQERHLILGAGQAEYDLFAAIYT